MAKAKQSTRKTKRKPTRRPARKPSLKSEPLKKPLDALQDAKECAVAGQHFQLASDICYLIAKYKATPTEQEQE